MLTVASRVPPYNGLSEALSPRLSYFDCYDITSWYKIACRKGMLLFYYVIKPFSLGVVLLDKKDNQHILWRSRNPLWQTQESITPINIKRSRRGIVFLFENNRGKISYLRDMMPDLVLTDLAAGLRKSIDFYRGMGV